MKIGMFPGSFNPIHEGHLDIIKRASKLFDKLLVVVSINIDKKPSDMKKRYQEVQTKVKKLHLKNVEVYMNDKFTIDFAKEHNCKYIVRSIRNTKDFKYELMIAQANNKFDDSIQTILLIADPALKNISSHAIREMNKNVKKFNWKK